MVVAGASTMVVAGPAVIERITAALVPRAAEDLRQLHERTGLSKTDLANRAITLYEFIEGHLRRS